jgi:hypothetical protein
LFSRTRLKKGQVPDLWCWFAPSQNAQGCSHQEAGSTGFLLCKAAERLSSSITSISVSYARQREHILRMLEILPHNDMVSSGNVGCSSVHKTAAQRASGLELFNGLRKATA